MINRAGLLAFWAACRAVQAVSPSGKISVSRWASPRSNGPGISWKHTDRLRKSKGGESDTTSDPAVLEVLEGWVDQLHGYIDNIEQGIEIPVAADAQRKCMLLSLSLPRPQTD